MRHARLTWAGAYHHIMNRGVEGKSIFKKPKFKNLYIDILREQSSLYKIRIFAYCIMDNHFHLVLENNSMKLSEFMKTVNSKYGILYRKIIGGKGYVFQDRFKSTLIENESYLLTAIVYALQNPVRKMIIDDPFKYKWSSVNAYFKEQNSSFVEAHFVSELFGTKRNFTSLLKNVYSEKLSEKNSRFGRIMGSEKFALKAENSYDRRSEIKLNLNKRITDKYFEPIEKVIYEFEKKIGKKIENIDVTTYKGKRERGELLVYLRDNTGLKYKEIFEFDIFRDLKFNSLGHLYSSSKKRFK